MSYSQGRVVTRKCRKDETYLRVRQWVDGTACVFIGVTRELAQARRAAEARIIVTRRTLGDYQRETGHPGFGSGEVPGYGGVEAINVDACQ